MDDQLVSMLYPVLGTSIIEGDRLRVLGAVAGPAGSSAMDLPGGGIWEVDHLDPSIPVRFEVDLRGADRSPLLIAAFGGDGALYLADQAVGDRMMEPSDAGHMDPIPPRPDREDYAVRSGNRRPDDPDLMTGRVVVLSDMASDPDSPPLVRIAAMAELSLKAYGASGGELLLAVLPIIRNTAAAMASEVGDEDLSTLGPGLSSRLASALRRFGAAGGSVGSPLLGLAERIRDRARSRTGSFAVVSRTGTDDDLGGTVVLTLGDVMARRHHDDDGRADEGRVGDARTGHRVGNEDTTREYLAMHRPRPGVLRVTVARSEHPRWVRVTHDDGSLPLAQAPLRPSDLVEVAELLVPPEVVDEDLRVEVLDPGHPDPSEIRPTRLIRRAVDLGRDAARITRVHGTVAAAPTWSACADAWHSVGDLQRARAARTCMGDIETGPYLDPYLADEVALALSDRIEGHERSGGPR